MAVVTAPSSTERKHRLPIYELAVSLFGLVRGGMEDKHLTPAEREAFEQHEAELLANEQSIIEEIEKLDLNKMSRELLEQMAAKWHLELSAHARDFQNELPEFTLSNLLKSKRFVYKRTKRRSLLKDVLIFDTQFKGRYLHAELIGRLREKEIARKVRSKSGCVRASQDPATKALDEIIEKYKEKPKGWFEGKNGKNRLSSFVTEMHAKYPIIKNRQSILNRITNYEESLKKMANNSLS